MQARKLLAGQVTLALTAALLCGCGGGGSAPGGGTGTAPPTPAPSPPPPPPPPPPPASIVGAVYAGTNNSGPGGNYVVGFGRRADGTLVPLDAHETGGVGRASLSSTTPRLNALVAEDSIIAIDNRFIIVVNAGTNNITSFRINGDYSLTRVDIEESGGTSPVSLAYRNGVVYVANADADGAFTGPDDQSGNITAMRLDMSNGQLAPIAGFSLGLRGRPSDLEVTPDGAYLIASAFNAGSALLPGPTAPEVSSFRIEADGTLAGTPSGTGTSTQPNNPNGRNLPGAIGIETFARNNRQFLIAAETRSTSPNGAPATGLRSVQTGSVSTWEIAADGSLVPRSQDFLLGPSSTMGPRLSAFVAYSSYGFATVASLASATLTSLVFADDGSVQFATEGYQIQGNAADPNAADPFAGADGYVDLAFNSAGNTLYQLVGLKGRIDVYAVVFSYELEQQVTTNLLPMDNLQGLVVVDAAGP